MAKYGGFMGSAPEGMDSQAEPGNQDLKGVPGERLPEKISISPAVLVPGHIPVSSLN